MLDSLYLSDIDFMDTHLCETTMQSWNLLIVFIPTVLILRFKLSYKR